MRCWIVQIGEPIPGLDGDVREWRCWMLSRLLASKGHEVTYWASGFDHLNKKHRECVSDSITPLQGLSVRLLKSPGYTRNISLKRLFDQRCLAREFAKCSGEVDRPDVIFCGLPTPELAEACVEFGVENDVPVVIDIRDPWPDVYLTMLPDFLRPLGRIALVTEYARLKRICRGATAVVAVSESYLAWALEHASRSRTPRDRVFPLGCRVGAGSDRRQEARAQLRKDYGIASEALVAAFVGSFGASYDLETVVEAAGVLEAKGRDDIRIILAGGGDRETDLRRDADSIGNVTFTGWLDGEQVNNLLAASDAGLAAYAGNAVQSLPNKPFEYMAWGLPLLSSLRGDLERIIDEKRIGLQYRAGDPEDLARCLIELADNLENRVEMGRRAEQVLREEFDAEKIYPALAEYLESLGGS